MKSRNNTWIKKNFHFRSSFIHIFISNAISFTDLNESIFRFSLDFVESRCALRGREKLLRLLNVRVDLYIYWYSKCNKKKYSVRKNNKKKNCKKNFFTARCTFSTTNVNKNFDFGSYLRMIVNGNKGLWYEKWMKMKESVTNICSDWMRFTNLNFSAFFCILAFA